MRTQTEFKCPVCNGLLTSTLGDGHNPNNGVTISCINMNCGMADWGHGKNDKEAFDIFKQKCGVTGRE